MKLLLAEDERELSNALCAILRHNNCSVDAVYDGAEALDYAEGAHYDVIILDIMMPSMSGLEVLKRLRGDGFATPVLLLTARSATGDKVAGLDAGADDYLTKPFSTSELLARIRALSRRSEDYRPNVVSFGNIRLDRATFELKGEGAALRLAGKEFQMLDMLVSSPGRLISADTFLERIWDIDSPAENNVVWVYISNLRKKLAAVGADVAIKAVRGVGYTLERVNADD